jgi:hypothetical protein
VTTVPVSAPDPTTPAGSDLLLDGPFGDGLVDGPFQGAHQPGVAGEPDFGGAGVDAFDQSVIESDGNLLHADTISELTSDITSDIILGMTTTTQEIEYALMVNYSDGSDEFIPAKSADHADTMARTIFADLQCWTVGRPVQPWQYARRSDAELTDEVAR